MPDIEIVVEAALGDSLAKLGLAKRAVDDLGDSGGKTSRDLHDFNTAMDDTTIASAKAGESILKTDHLIRDAENTITGAAEAIDGGGGSSGGVLVGAIANLGDEAAANAPLLSGLVDILPAIPVLAIGAAIGVVALADALGTLVAIVGDLVAPLSVVTGLLGGLGIAFVLAAKQAFGDGGGLSGQVSVLKNQFDNFTKTLANDFMPVFEFLIHNAHEALTWLNQIAKLPLDDAFKKLAQQGVPAVTHFLEQIGHMVAHPIRLAFQIAFGTGKAGNEASAAVSQLWRQLSDFLFGYTKSHPIRLDGRVIQIDRQHVDGIFQPLIDWFNRHDFTKQGIQIGHEMLNGFLTSGAAQRLGQFLVTVLGDATHTVAHQMMSALGGDAVSYIKGHWEQISSMLTNLANPLMRLRGIIADQIGGAVQSVASKIRGAVGGAINAAIGLANRFWGILQKIADFFSRTFSLNISWPSPPSWLTSLGGLLGGGSSTAPGAGRLRAQGNGGGGRSGASVMMAPQFHYHDHSGAGRANFRRFAHEVNREIHRQQAVLAGGV